MKISASIINSKGNNQVRFCTNENFKQLSILPRPDGKGLSVNGGEMLFLALATCFCNDIYREAAKREMEISSVEVTVNGEFGGEGEAAKYINYQAKVEANASTEEINDLIMYVDGIAEIHNTLRGGVEVMLIQTKIS